MNLKEKIDRKNISVSVIGLGHIGLPLALRISESAIHVTGIDIDTKLIQTLSNGDSHLSHIDSKRVKKSLQKNLLTLSCDDKKIQQTDVTIICVPTLLTEQNEPDLTKIINVTNIVSKNLKENLDDEKLIIIESTLPPKATREILLPILLESGRTLGENLYISYSPEREDPGNHEFSTQTIPKLVSGLCDHSLNNALNFYSLIIDNPIPVASTEVAEMAKLIENAQRLINISFANEMKILMNRIDMNIDEVLDACATKPFGFQKVSAGPGIGGHCIPLTPQFLSSFSKTLGINSQLIDTATSINLKMPDFVLEQVGHHFQSPNQTRLLVLGITYKKNIAQVDSSPSLEIFKSLMKRGYQVSYHDPFHQEILIDGQKLESGILSRKYIENFDCVVLLTDHDQVDYDLVALSSRMIIDTRGKFTIDGKRVIKA
ncbi:nucleotide sugar dehydrogenase [Halobacteriovorax sp. GB3]|uniref:nucleotide sugar dehydrogenase n=1 Tax=Halobacteriovorax sp. GB3 TaxID=2719615 RepID=UPI00235F68AE|nr:nucleotide sugar dehydrogenase [Halobacteriovorax sp. GB3]MDD0852556.1 nucleotide sugar dehydrogenase [Halobacteriovorax sp. GB3]